MPRVFLKFLRNKLRRSRKYLAAWKQVVQVLKINVDYMQVNTAMPSVLSVRFPENFVLFTKSLNFVNVDFISVTGASCFPGVNFTTSFFTMSLLPIFACLIGLWVYFRGKKVISRQGNTEKEVVNSEIRCLRFTMIVKMDSDALKEMRAELSSSPTVNV